MAAKIIGGIHTGENGGHETSGGDPTTGREVIGARE
jgi:hypothetical protein